MKSILRNKIKELRKNLTEKDVEEKSKLIKEKLFSLEEFRLSSSVMFYISFGKEVKTKEMIEQSVKSNKKVIIPYIKNNRIELSVFKDFNELEKGNYSILVPKKEFIRNFKDSVDIVIIPGIAFDEKGNRIGFGKGFYDKLLSEDRFKDTIKIALAYEDQIILDVPNEEHDIRVDKIVTENRVIECR